MKILVLGSGLLGVTAAYELGRRGHEVAVIDRQAVSGAETSFANGGQLSYSHAEPWANPSVLPKILPWMFRSDAPLVLRPRADWQMITWGLKFLRNCTVTRANANCVNTLRLGLYSKLQMEVIRSETGIAFDFSDKGILHIYSTDEDFDTAKRHNEFQTKFGGEERVLTREQCIALEPTLAGTSRTIVGGIHAFKDESGDAYLFCNELAKIAAERHGVQFRYDMSTQRLFVESNQVVGVKTDKGDITADIYVMAMGSYSPIYLRSIGINLPIYPMKGYSITLKANSQCPDISLTDGTHKIVYSRLGDRLRVAGTAEFAGHNTNIRQHRIDSIIKVASGLFPGADWNQDIKTWACLRPSTPDGPPVIGYTPYNNLFLNTGHGTLGWTQAAGSAAILADNIEGHTPEIMTHGLTMERYL